LRHHPGDLPRTASLLISVVVVVVEVDGNGDGVAIARSCLAAKAMVTWSPSRVLSTGGPTPPVLVLARGCVVSWSAWREVEYRYSKG
jgi:hypothetical protein